ncbi:EspA/EspE family type VII secretion system effector [Mycobacterium sp. BMJ-28]
MGVGGGDLLKDLFELGNGIRSGVQDVPKLFQDVVSLDAHGVLTDGRKVIGDVGDVLNGLGGLGMGLTKVPQQIAEKYAGSTIGKLADSQILSAAQMAIDAEKATTGSGEPEDGNGYHESAVRMQDVVQTLSDADPRGDRWNGEAAKSYERTNSAHRTHASAVQGADGEIGRVLSIEAGQVSRARKTLDETNQYLSDFGAATAWMNFVPGLRQAKMVADLAAASAALATTNTTMAVLVKNAAENAARIELLTGKYTDANGDNSGKVQDKHGNPVPGAPFVTQEVDTGKQSRPERLDPSRPYWVPTPDTPPNTPGIPYGAEAPSPASDRIVEGNHD